MIDWMIGLLGNMSLLLAHKHVFMFYRFPLLMLHVVHGLHDAVHGVHVVVHASYVYVSIFSCFHPLCVQRSCFVFLCFRRYVSMLTMVSCIGVPTPLKPHHVFADVRHCAYARKESQKEQW